MFIRWRGNYALLEERFFADGKVRSKSIYLGKKPVAIATLKQMHEQGLVPADCFDELLCKLIIKDDLPVKSEKERLADELEKLADELQQLKAGNQNLADQLEQFRIVNQDFIDENQRLRLENQKLADELQQLKADSKNLDEENQWLRSDTQEFADENQQPIAGNQDLEELQQLKAKSQVPRRPRINWRPGTWLFVFADQSFTVELTEKQIANRNAKRLVERAAKKEGIKDFSFDDWKMEQLST